MVSVCGFCYRLLIVQAVEAAVMVQQTPHSMSCPPSWRLSGAEHCVIGLGDDLLA
jgi:hypothetical protein